MKKKKKSSHEKQGVKETKPMYQFHTTYGYFGAIYFPFRCTHTMWLLFFGVHNYANSLV